MNLPVSISWRYFYSKKSAQAINIISWVSMVAIAVSSAAMVILFSVFNGLEDTVKGMYTAFYPDIKVTTVQGKFFQVESAQKKRIATIPGVENVCYTLEDMVLLHANDEQKVATLKGVDNNWFYATGLGKYMLDGKAIWPNEHSFTPAILGSGIAISLGIDVNNVFSALHIYYPRRGAVMANVEQAHAALNSIKVKPEGAFEMQDDISGEYILVPFEAARRLLQTEGQVSTIEIKLKSPQYEDEVKQEVARILGDSRRIETRYEQNKTFYMIMRSEKWAVYAILLMVLLIASFNMIGSLLMMVLEKKKDITIMKAMGAESVLIGRIFLFQGAFQAILGGGIGILLGFLICCGQLYFGWIALPDGFIIEAYPVKMQVADFVLVIFTALLVGLLAAWYPAWKASRQMLNVRAE